MDDSREAKQRFLQAEIIDKGLSASDFTARCEELKGADVDNWTLEELKTVVKEFQEECRRASSRQSKEKGSELFGLSNESFAVSEAAELPTEGAQLYTVSCQMLTDTELSTVSGVAITILEPELIPGSLFSSSYVIYPVQTMPMEWGVRRRLCDFVWLRDILAVSFPGYYIPPIPNSSLKEKLTKPEMARRQRVLQDFINGVLRTPVFRRSPFFTFFLKEEFAKNFSAVKKQSARTKRPAQLEDLLSLTGTVSCNASMLGTYAANANEFLHHSHGFMKKIKKQLEEVKSLFAHVARKMQETAETIKLLAELQSSIPESAVHLQIYRDLSEITLKWSSFQLENSNIVNDELSLFFHRRIAEVKAMKQLLREREQALSEYSKLFRKLQSRKKKLWEAKDTAKWGLEQQENAEELLANKDYAFSKMLPLESAAVETLRKFYNFYNYQVTSEIARVFGDAGEQENLHFAGLSGKMLDMMSGMSAEWQEVQHHFSSAVQS